MHKSMKRCLFVTVVLLEVAASGVARAAVPPPPPPQLREYQIAPPIRGLSDIVQGPDGKMWFTEGNGGASGTGVVGRITSNGTVTEFPVPDALASPYYITDGPDGAMWFTAQNGSIGRITAAGAMTAFPVPNVAGRLADITTGPDGNLWFAKLDQGSIVRMTTSGDTTEFVAPVDPTGQTSTNIQGLTAGPDGNLWFTEFSPGRIGRITTAGEITEYPIPTGDSSFPFDINVGADGNLWFTEIAGNVGRITPAGVVTEFPVEHLFPFRIALAGDGSMWFSENQDAGLGRIDTAGNVTEYALPDPRSGPSGIAAGPGRSVWFLEGDINRIASTNASKPPPKK